MLLAPVVLPRGGWWGGLKDNADAERGTVPPTLPTTTEEEDSFETPLLSPLAPEPEPLPATSSSTSEGMGAMTIL